MKVIMGSDHAGFDLKEKCKARIETMKGFEAVDIGVFNTEPADYPRIAHQVAGAVSQGEYACGILICGSGIGMSIVANRYRGARAALCHNLYTARMARRHNDANILVMGERVIGWGLALEMVEVFLNTPFEGGRHQLRRDQIEC